MSTKFEAVLRNATPNDVERIVAFLISNPSPNIKLRRTEAYEASVANDVFYVLEVDEQLIAVAGVFPIVEDSSDYELGSLYLVESYRGFGIQELMMPLGIAATLIFDSEAIIYAGVRNGPLAESSRRNIKAAGFEPLVDKDDPLFESTCPSCDSRPESGDSCCGTFYVLPRDRYCDHIRKLLLGGDVVYRRRNGAELRIEIKAQVLANPKRAILKAECSPDPAG